jgi:hypothetical protein
MMWLRFALMSGFVCSFTACAINKVADPEDAALLDKCVETVQPSLLSETSCPRGIGPPAKRCDRPLSFVSPPTLGFRWPPNSEAYQTNPARWEEEMIQQTAKANENYSYRIYKVFGVLPAGQKMHVTEIRQFASNSYELGVFWAAVANLDDGPFAGHSIRIPSGADSAAWITPDGMVGPFSRTPPPKLVPEKLKPCNN